MPPVVSIIIPAYNAAETLQACLQSVLAQSHRHLELIVVDDGSTDGTSAICREYAARDDRIRMLRQENCGVSAARNAGLDAATGDYALFADADDTLAPDMVEHYVRDIERSGADLAIGGIAIETPDGVRREFAPPPGDYGAQEFWPLVCREGTGLYGYTPNKLYRRAFLEEHGLRFPCGVGAQEDLHFALHAYAKARSFSLHAHCGYTYLHRGTHRSVPFEQLIGNQIFLADCARAHGTPPADLAPVVLKVQGLLYGQIYSLRDTIRLAALRESRDWEPYLQGFRDHPAFTRLLLAFFRGRNYRSCRRLVRLREWAKRFTANLRHTP